MALEREIETYRRRLTELLADKGKYVLIHGEDLVGVFPGLEETLRAGYERFGDEPFLARQIAETEKVYTLSRSIRPCPMSPDG